ncbi:LapA family protein [Nocardia caishijiensis]|uniref:Integral membrane protein n=1 Tax=Nocardia caishijiensis TaxID=184756 RepID=A0ABQ6YQ24_9NOCA|nr:lipopolysaccharide assembly protein LapA domain-containing protein [Nocardia caishijiensis]KAF0847836.1 putative integral membrane protein [Nocardia caishijiensis]
MTTNAESGASPAEHDPASTGRTDKSDKHDRTVEPVGRARDALHGSRTGYTWIGLLTAALLGIVLLVFIIQNLDKARVELLFWSFELPLGITVLLSVIAGALVMGLLGSVRILQLRHAAKKQS